MLDNDGYYLSTVCQLKGFLGSAGNSVNIDFFIGHTAPFEIVLGSRTMWATNLCVDSDFGHASLPYFRCGRNLPMSAGNCELRQVHLLSRSLFNQILN